jgi:hypothetical protein
LEALFLRDDDEAALIVLESVFDVFEAGGGALRLATGAKESSSEPGVSVVAGRPRLFFNGAPAGALLSLADGLALETLCLRELR